MARNKYPEETVRRILDTAGRLFMVKGYDETTLQDIIDETRLSKGAIYHHFTCKEEIFMRICERAGENNAVIYRQIRDSRDLSGKEKLKKIFKASVLASSQKEILSMVPYLFESPKFMAIQIRNIYDEVVPDYIKPILEEGIQDGSICTDYPKELAEAVMMLSNVWLHPLCQPTTPEELRARCAVFNQITGVFGVEILDEELVEALIEYSRLIQKKHEQRN